MNCYNCGRKLRKDQPVCPWCGASQDAKPAEKKTNKKQDADEPKMVQLGAKGTKKAKKGKKWLVGVLIGVGAVLLALIITAVVIFSSMLGNINREDELSAGEIGVNSELPDDVQNIALFGLDTRSNDDNGRSDAIIILSIDRAHNKIKLTSIARDSLVPIEGHGQSKITHAFSWGGAKLAVKTLNQNFGLNITDYAYLNFFEFAEIIDYIGGVMIDVDAAELNVMNNYYGPELRKLGFDYQNATSGYVRLNGVQALAYSRNRYTGSDIDRGNRQKEVLEAMFAQVKDTPVTKYPSLANRILSICHTTLTNTELIEMATWTIGASPTFEQFTLPSKECKAIGGSYGSHGWVWRFDMQVAADVLYDFIYEPAESEDDTSSAQ
ncbi:MAG: LCP family protein [Clostridia bacterium]|nr:LCP family protein [Clostridia bacterium]